MPVPNSFANVTTSIPLSQLDANFNTPITLGNTAIQLGNTVTTLNNMTFANATITSGNVTLTNVTVTTANVTTANIATAVITTANVTTANITTGNVSGNLTFTGTGNRITGDFSNATIANRVLFQTSTTNGPTAVFAIPNGTNTNCNFTAVNNSDTTNAATAQLAALATDVRIASSITGTGTYLPMTFYTGGSESMRLSATSKALILSGGDTTANGTGITFPATQSASSNANTLDDYEEGTFTPVAIGSTTEGTASYSVQVGRYTKIGNRVLYALHINYTGGTGSGFMLIGGLPFTSNSTTNNLPLGTIYPSSLTLTASNVALTFVGPSSTQISFNQYPVGGGAATTVNYDAAATLLVSGHYEV